jgi:carbonic anhydrase
LELVPDDITISGAIYDVQTGELREVVRDQRLTRPER